MLQLSERQKKFASAILNPELAVPVGLVGPDGEVSERRFAVYRNNVVSGLVETLRATYPAVARIVGDEFFRAMARHFVAAHPPISPIMLFYGAGFADFIASFAPAQGLTYLADVARVERCWIESYHAADMQPISEQDLAREAPENFASLRLALHPALRFFTSPFPALSIWQMNVAGVPKPIDLDQTEDILITRPQMNVDTRVAPNGTTAFLSVIARHGTMAEAADAAFKKATNFDLAEVFSGLISVGAFAGVTEP